MSHKKAFLLKFYNAWQNVNEKLNLYLYYFFGIKL